MPDCARNVERRCATQAVTTKTLLGPVCPTALVGETRRRDAGALKCAQGREKEVGKGKVWEPKTLLGRAEMHAEAFVQVAAGERLVCSSAFR